MSNEVPDGSRLVQVFFQEGQLGVTLRRRVEDGVVYVHELVPNTQGVLLDIELGDELWKVGDSLIGTTSLDKEAWQALVQYIKACPRPLAVTWRRRLKDAYDDSPRIQERKAVSAQVPAPPISSEPPSSNTIKPMPVISSKEMTPPSISPQPTENENNQIRQEVYKSSVDASSPVEQPVGDVNDVILAELSSQLYIKEKSSMAQAFGLPLGKPRSGKSINLDGKNLPVSPYTLPDNPLRKLIKFGEMSLTSAKSSSISMTMPSKLFLLMSDILVVCVSYPNDILLMEECINLQVCKIRTYLLPPLALTDSDLPAVFDLIWPNGSLQTGFMTDEGKEEWMQAIYQSICQSIGYGNDILGWKHQHMLGTVHSAVVLRDASLLQSIVDACERQDLDFALLEAKDDSGFTPLHYASIFRFTNMIQILHDASANAEIPDRNGLTCLHWSSMLLEDDALEILTEHSIDIDVRDYDDRTSLFLVMVEGRDKTGRVNQTAMKDCGKRLLDLHAEPNVADHHGNTILHYLSASWMNELVELMLQYNAEIMAGNYDYGMTALHFACRGVPLRRKISEATVLLSSTKISDEQRAAVEDADLHSAIPTLKTLLRAGSRPNYKDSNGKTPLHHIAENWDTTWGDSLAYAVITLLTYGARMDDSAQCQVLRSRLHSVEIDTILETRLNAPCIDADALGIS
jgi:ankyrin repeat protein